MDFLTEHILSILIVLPTLGAIGVAVLPQKGKIIPGFALLITVATFVISLHLPAHFLNSTTGFQFEEKTIWIHDPLIHYHVGIDGLSLWLVVLTTFLAPLGVLISWRAIAVRTKEFYLLFLLQQTAMIGIFVALDLFLYYAFWEMSLIPMALLIGMFGRANGRRAAIKFFLYTFIPSALLLVAMVWLYAKNGTFDFVTLSAMRASGSLQLTATAAMLAALAFLLAFAVKVPIFPLHGWLSDALSEAPTAAAMVLAGKLGLYSIVRFSFGLFPAESRRMAPILIALGVIGILYGALIAYVQTDLKRLASYSTLSHLGFCVLGIFSFTAAGVDGGVYQILNHGISAGAFFMLLGILYERYGTYDMSAYGGLAAKLPVFSSLMVFTALSLIGLPILNGFVGEFLVLSGSFLVHRNWAIAGTAGVILSAAYMLTMLQRILYGPPSATIESSAPFDLNLREQIAMWPMLILIVLMGVTSSFWMRAIDTISAGHAPAAAYGKLLSAPMPQSQTESK